VSGDASLATLKIERIEYAVIAVIIHALKKQPCPCKGKH
jgi:hypothetical protein